VGAPGAPGGVRRRVDPPTDDLDVAQARRRATTGTAAGHVPQAGKKRGSCARLPSRSASSSPLAVR
jgi:hypothetical protein